MTPARGTLTVRRIDTPESLPHGCILLTPATRESLTASQFEVVAVGAPSICEDENCERPHEWLAHDLHTYGHLPLHCTVLKPQDWVLVRHRSLSPTHQDGLYSCHHDDVLAILEP